MNRKGKGTRNEHRTMRVLEAAGYTCRRAAGSLGVWDVIGIGSSDVPSQPLEATLTERVPGMESTVAALVKQVRQLGARLPIAHEDIPF